MNYRKLAIEKKLSLNFVIKEYKLMEYLPKVYNLPFNIVLKGGTALNQIYLEDFQRFSEDLDFDIFEDVTVENLKKHLKKEGFEIKKTFYRPFNIGFECKYEVNNIKDIIKLEFKIEDNKQKKREIVTKTAKSNIANFMVANIKTYSLKEIARQKVEAILSRDEGKDYYDLLFAIKKLSKKTLEELKSNINKKELIKRIESITIRELSKTNPFIPKDKRLDWKIIKDELVRVFS